MIKPKQIVLIGLGGIAYQYDFSSEKRNPAFEFEDVKSHFGAAQNHEFTILGGIDSDREARDRFHALTGLDAYSSLLEMSNLQNASIFVIATSTESHFRIFEDICKYAKPEIIICEKPFGASYGESLEMARLSKSANIPVVVNYSRLFSDDFYKIKQAMNINNFKFGVILYSQGLRQNGSHFLRLVLEILGEPLLIEKYDSLGRDDNPSFRMTYSFGRYIDFKGINSKNLRIGDIYFETDSNIIAIDKGDRFRIWKLTEGLNPTPWPDEFQEIDSGRLIGGLNCLYGKIQNCENSKFKSLFGTLELDLACSKILESILTS